MVGATVRRGINGRDLAHVSAPDGLTNKVNQVGSHIILQAEIAVHHRLAMPDYKPLRIGPLNAILR
jgi:hypothetical protein